MNSMPSTETPESEELMNQREILKTYLLEHDATFRALDSLRKQCWSSPEVDNILRIQQKRAASPTQKQRKIYYRVTLEIGAKMAENTDLFKNINWVPRVLDLCMAPGGFTATVQARYPKACVDAITLSPDHGGHEVMVQNPRIKVIFADITMYAAEFGVGVSKIPLDHPDRGILRQKWPFHRSSYNLIFCGGAVLRTHTREDYRDGCEASRLTMSQLILAMQRIANGGTLILLMHKVDAWYAFSILRAFEMFAEIELFKPSRVHAMKSSFYMIANNVNPQHPEAIKALQGWKEQWYRATFEPFHTGDLMRSDNSEESETDIMHTVEEYGPRLIELGRPIWTIQAEALRKTQTKRSTA